MSQINKDQPQETWTRSLSERGQTVVPKKVRKYLNVKGGDSLEWNISTNGEVTVKPKKRKSVMDLEGVIQPEYSIEDMDQVIQKSKEERINQKMREGRL